MTDKALEAALLPCPFCGSSAQIERSWVPRSGERLAICSNSACVAHHGEQDEQGGWSCETYFNNEAAIAAWNRRSPLSSLSGEAEVVAFKHPISNWAHVQYSEIDMHCPKDGPRPIPLVTLASLQAMQARAEAAERERDYWQKLHDERTAFLGQCATEKEAAEARVKELEEENARLRRLDAEYGRVETAIIMADPDFDGDSPHDNCGDRLIASVHRLRDLAALTGGSNG